MGVKDLGSNMRIFRKLTHLYITPYINEDTVGLTKYDFRAIVADSVVLEPDDNSINTKEAEFYSSPLFENVQLGAVNFTSVCIDFQNDVLKEIFGFVEDDGVLLAPSEYHDRWAVVELEFQDRNLPNVVIPKLKLNTKAVIGTLKTGSAEGTIQGKAEQQSFTVYVDDGQGGTDTVLGTSTVFFLPVNAQNYDVRSDYGYMLWDNNVAMLWDDGSNVLN